MKNKKTFLAILPAMLALSACGIFDNGKEKIDTSKTQIFIGVFDGGFGTSYIDSLKNKFEKDFAEVSYEEGKKGVQIICDAQRFLRPSSYRTYDYDVIIAEQSGYYQYINQGEFLDLTDIVTSPADASKFGENKTVLEKLYDSSIDYLKVDNKFYALPHYTGSYGITYDKDLFNRLELYFQGDPERDMKAAYNLVGKDKMFEMCGSSNKTVLSSGPNGIIGDYDDGLPQTIEQFIYLCGEMKEKGIQTPIEFTGQTPGYLTSVLTSLAINLNPIEEADLVWGMSGSSKTLIDNISNDGKVTYLPETQITETNGNMAFKQAGRYYALKVAETLYKSGYVAPSTSNNAHSHTDAQHAFIKGTYSSVSSSDTKVGMLFDGSWWENESASYFDEMSDSGFTNAKRLDRHFAVMPMPKLDDNSLGQNIFYDPLQTICFGMKNDNENRNKATKDLIRYMYTDKMLSDFTRVTGSFINAIYDISDADKASLSSYSKSIAELKNDSKIITPVSGNNVYKAKQGDFIDVDYGWNSSINSIVYKLGTFFRTGQTDPSLQNAKTFFDGIATYYNDSYWANYIK